MVKYSFLTETGDGTVELPFNDTEAVITIMAQNPGAVVLAIWRLSIDKETPTLGRCIHVWTKAKASK